MRLRRTMFIHRRMMKLKECFFLLLLVMTTASTTSDDENIQTCFHRCRCITFLKPTVSSAETGWPALKSTSLFSNPNINATSFEDLITSFQEENNIPQYQLPTVAPKSPKDYLRSALATYSSAMLSGEVSLNCSGVELPSLSKLLNSSEDTDLLDVIVKM